MGVADPGQFPEPALPNWVRLGRVLPLVELQLPNLFNKHDSVHFPRQPLGSRTLQSPLHQEWQNSRTEGAPISRSGRRGRESWHTGGPLTLGSTVSLPPRSRSLHQEGHRRNGRPKERGFYH